MAIGGHARPAPLEQIAYLVEVVANPAGDTNICGIGRFGGNQPANPRANVSTGNAVF